MDQELIALRRLAYALSSYQQQIARTRRVERETTPDPADSLVALINLSNAEFELSEALGAWYQIQPRFTDMERAEPPDEFDAFDLEFAALFNAD
ncbi:MAG TPA: hypothetical protein VFD70_27000 [Anaerolineae bacterium]|nr:hypothetical protein [Anaerolineae bacterium]